MRSPDKRHRSRSQQSDDSFFEPGGIERLLSQLWGGQDAAGFSSSDRTKTASSAMRNSVLNYGVKFSEESAMSTTARTSQVNLAVVGAEGVGKSTFVKFALGLQHAPIARSSIKKISLGGSIHLVRLLEIAMHNVTFGENGCIVLPTVLGEHVLPAIDGILCLFDPSDLTTVTRYSHIFDALSESSNIPFVVVACNNRDTLQTPRHNPAVFEQACRVLAGVRVLKATANDPESHKKCISTLIEALVYPKRTSSMAYHSAQVARQQQLASRPRSRSAAVNPDLSHHHHQSVRYHARSNSEHPSLALIDSAIRPERPDGVPADSTKADNLALNAHGSRYVRSDSQPVPPRTPPRSRLNRGTTLTADTVPEDSPPNGKSPHRLPRTNWRHSGGSDAFSSFLDMEDETDDPVWDDGASQVPAPGSEKGKDNDAGLTFDELVDRLLSVPLSKQDGKFVAIFLCLYRKFSTPAHLLDTLVTRFEQLGNSEIPMLLRQADQLRLLTVMGHWVSEYPADFSGANTRKRLIDFIATLEQVAIFAFAAKEMDSSLEKFIEDEDACWAVKDESDPASGVETFLDTSVPSSPSTFVAQTVDGALANNMSSLDLTEEGADFSSQYSSMSTTSSVNRSGSISNQSLKTLLSVETAQEAAQRLEVVPRNLLSKIQWRLFMGTPDEDFAKEVTRIDWIMYSSFRPRELIRHVSTSAAQKDAPSNHLENVNRMIKEFNHLAYFVASMVLLRDKAKHRAQALEKFTSIAGKLRALYNYNSLGAIIAGLNGTPVYRLTQTRDHLPNNIQKQFMSLVILMGTQKSHFAYRLAWENSFSERIPFLPLHLRDLVSAEEGNKTFVGANNDRINWRKFEVMGEVVLGIQQSQRTPFPSFNRNDLVQRLLLETKLSGDEEELYNRSLQIEPSAGAGEPQRRRFGWRRN